MVVKATRFKKKKEIVSVLKVDKKLSRDSNLELLHQSMEQIKKKRGAST